MIDGLSVLDGARRVAFAGSEAEVFRRGILWLAPVALVPLAMLGWLRAAPESALAFAGLFLRPAPARVSEWAMHQLRGFAAGLGALRGGAHLAWIAVHSVGIWLVASTLPILAAIWAVGIDLGGPVRTLAATWMTLAALGAAVALPSAPGFFGLYHSACRLALQQFGATAESALAVGMLAHAVFWVTLTGLVRSCCARDTHICGICRVPCPTFRQAESAASARSPRRAEEPKADPAIGERRGVIRGAGARARGLSTARFGFR